MTITTDDIIRSLEALSPEAMEDFLARLMARTGISLPATAPAPFATMGAPLMGAIEVDYGWDLHLLDHGPDKIAVIKVVRELKGLTLGLREARDLVESAPVVVAEGLSRSQAGEVAARLEQAGAKVALR